VPLATVRVNAFDVKTTFSMASRVGQLVFVFVVRPTNFADEDNYPIDRLVCVVLFNICRGASDFFKRNVR